MKIFTGGGGGDTVTAAMDYDILDGGAGDDSLVASPWNDISHWGNLLIGGAGADMLTGGNGTDFFLLAPGATPYLGALDIITDWSSNDYISFAGPAATASNYRAFIEATLADARARAAIELTNGVRYVAVQFGSDVALFYKSVVDDGIVGVALPGRTLNDVSYTRIVEGIDASAATAGQTLSADVSAQLDYVVGGSGDDLLTGVTVARNMLSGGAGNDSLVGGDWDDILLGGAGNDTLDGGRGDETSVLAGGDGVDLVTYASAISGVTVWLSQQPFTQFVGGGTGFAQILAEIENVTGSAFNDSLTGDTGVNVLLGAGGDDVIRAFEGQIVAGDVLDGGLGVDTLTAVAVVNFTTATLAGFEKLTAIQDEEAAPQTSISTFTASQIASGFAANLQVSGGFGANRIVIDGSGGGAVDLSGWTFTTWDTADTITVQGSAGGDVYAGSSARDVLNGLVGDDTLGGGGDADTVSGGDGNDLLYSNAIIANAIAARDLGLEQDSLSGGDGDDTLFAGYGDAVDGGTGSDRLFLSFAGMTTGATFSTAGLEGGSVTFGGATIQRVEFVVRLWGTNYADTLTIATQPGWTIFTSPIIDAGDGNDVITSFATPISLLGGDGNDRYITGSAGDIFDGGAGFDTIDFAAATAGVSVSLATGSGAGKQLTSVEAISGSSHNDTLTGGGGGDDLYGLGGDDVLTGGAGSDHLDGGLGVDTAAFTNARANFWVQSIPVNGTITTWIVGGGADSLVNIEALSFNGATFALAGIQQNHKAVLDQGLFDDVLIRSASTGQIAFVDMIGQSTATQGVVRAATGALPAGWTAVASGDLTGIGNPQCEIIVQSPTGGLYYVDTLSGSPEWGVISANLPSEWKVVGLGDMTLDGSLDVVIRSSVSGNIMYAEMNDTAFSGWGNVFNMGTSWRAVGVADYDRDGDSDVLVQEIATGTTYYVQMQNGAFAGWGLVTGGPGSQWVAKEAADLNGDGYFDVVFQNSGTGQIWYVNMAGGVNSGWGTLVTAADWAVVGSGDYDNDGYADILVQSPTNGNLFYIDVDNGVMAGWGNIRTGIGTDWVAV